MTNSACMNSSLTSGFSHIVSGFSQIVSGFSQNASGFPSIESGFSKEKLRVRGTKTVQQGTYNSKGANILYSLPNTVILSKNVNSVLFWNQLYSEIKGRGKRGKRDFTVDPNMSLEDIKAAIKER
ncbi:hypothetical protein LF927_09015 [Pectobacterium polaris]|uniref:hypothetical protein n=1 Tax=Pectobacterium polaris TaxID=2042057 RepID=UPI001CF2FEB1|nr:hypothetical protein [Pectobacterium polaris]MCA6941323.1 hypothetical protein [Pectobacterium polaris]MCA6956377.1 hypothetical protein [Pectobacterium polaris]